MNRRHLALVAAWLVVGAVAAAYIAGAAFYILNKTVPSGISFDTWLRYWDAYSDDPQQRRHLLRAAAIAGAAVVAAPLLAIAAMNRSSRSLHGDARWANAAEIREAGLL